MWNAFTEELRDLRQGDAETVRRLKRRLAELDDYVVRIERATRRVAAVAAVARARELRRLQRYVVTVLELFSRTDGVCVSIGATEARDGIRDARQLVVAGFAAYSADVLNGDQVKSRAALIISLRRGTVAFRSAVSMVAV